MTGRYVRMIEEQALNATFDERSFKADVVRERGEKAGVELYVETSHMFIKTFHDVVVQKLTDVRVVHLRRRLTATLGSFVKLCYFTPRNPLWSEWMSSPFATTAAIRYPAEPLDEIDMTIAYLIDIEARAERFKSEYPSTPFMETTLDALNDAQGIRELLDFVAYPAPWGAVIAKMGETQNGREERKRYFNVQVDAGYLADRVAAFVSRMESQGVRLPATLMV